MYNTIDDFVMTNLKTYAGRPIKTAEAEDIDLGEDAAQEGDKSAAGAVEGLSTEDAEDLCSWLKESALTDKVRCHAYITPLLVVAGSSKKSESSRIFCNFPQVRSSYGSQKLQKKFPCREFLPRRKSRDFGQEVHELSAMKKLQQKGARCDFSQSMPSAIPDPPTKTISRHAHLRDPRYR